MHERASVAVAVAGRAGGVKPVIIAASSKPQTGDGQSCSGLRESASEPRRRCWKDWFCQMDGTVSHILIANDGD